MFFRRLFGLKEPDSLEDLLKGLITIAGKNPVDIFAKYTPQKNITKIKTPDMKKFYGEAISQATNGIMEDMSSDGKSYWVAAQKFPSQIPTSNQEIFRLSTVQLQFQYEADNIFVQIFPDKNLAEIDTPNEFITDYIKVAGWRWKKSNYMLGMDDVRYKAKPALSVMVEKMEKEK